MLPLYCCHSGARMFWAPLTRHLLHSHGKILANVGSCDKPPSIQQHVLFISVCVLLLWRPSEEQSNSRRDSDWRAFAAPWCPWGVMHHRRQFVPESREVVVVDVNWWNVSHRTTYPAILSECCRRHIPEATISITETLKQCYVPFMSPFFLNFF